MNQNSIINNFLNKHIDKYKKKELLMGDASTRMYYRVFTEKKNFILCRDDKLITVPYNEYLYNIIQKMFIKHKIPVPETYAVDKQNGLLLIQDLGDQLLEDLIPKLSKDEILNLYKKIIDILINIQSIKGSSVPFKLYFDVEKLMFEFNFFIENALIGYFKASISENEISKLKLEFIKISNILHRPEISVLNHRDFHSRNIMIHEDIPYIIDFQDARMGLPQYDAVSFLRDSYMKLDDGLFLILKNYYYECACENGILKMSKDEFSYNFDIMAFQRNIKAIGTFGYQVSSKKNIRYEKSISLTLGYLNNYIENQDELRTITAILKQYISF